MFVLHKLSDCLRKTSTLLRLISSLLYLLITVKYQSSLNFICRRTVTFPTLDWTCCCAGILLKCGLFQFPIASGAHQDAPASDQLGSVSLPEGRAALRHTHSLSAWTIQQSLLFAPFLLLFVSWLILRTRCWRYSLSKNEHR